MVKLISFPTNYIKPKYTQIILIIILNTNVFIGLFITIKKELFHSEQNIFHYL